MHQVLGNYEAQKSNAITAAHRLGQLLSEDVAKEQKSRNAHFLLIEIYLASKKSLFLSAQFQSLCLCAEKRAC